MAVLDFFLTPTAETARLKGCLTILLFDDIATKASRASGCEPELPVLQNLTAGRSSQSFCQSAAARFLHLHSAYRAPALKARRTTRYRRDPIENTQPLLRRGIDRIRIQLRRPAREGVVRAGSLAKGASKESALAG